jgi:hypothetical protein
VEHGGHGEHRNGHDKHAGHSPEMFRDRFWLSLLLAIPVVFTSWSFPASNGWVRSSERSSSSTAGGRSSRVL